MASSLQIMILFALIFIVAIPISMGRRGKLEQESDQREESDTEKYLRDLCSETKKSKECLNIIKSELTRFTNKTSRSIADVAIDLAIEKSYEINDELHQLYQDSGNDELKQKYLSCSSNYEDASRNLGIAKRSMDSDDFRLIPTEMDDVVQQLNKCKHEFSKDSSDPAHIRNRNKEFRNYLELARAAAGRYLREKDIIIDPNQINNLE